MATIFSDELVRARAGRRLNPNELAGKVRLIKYDFLSLPAGAIGDVLVCGLLKASERVLIGNELHTAAGAGTFNVGTYAVVNEGGGVLSLGGVVDVDAFLIGAAAGVGQNLLANLQAQGIGVGPLLVSAVDLFVCITNIGTAFTTAARFAGFLLVVGD